MRFKGHINGWMAVALRRERPAKGVVMQRVKVANY